MQEKKVVKERILDSIRYLKDSGFSSQEILRMLEQLQGSENVISAIRALLKPSDHELDHAIKIPLSIFKGHKLGSLETIVRYLREHEHLGFKRIGQLTGRKAGSLAVTYSNAIKKYSGKLIVESFSYSISPTLLRNRSLSVLENIVSYLKDVCQLSYHEIALMLVRDDRTIWTTYQRARKKRE